MTFTGTIHKSERHADNIQLGRGNVIVRIGMEAKEIAMGCGSCGDIN